MPKQKDLSSDWCQTVDGVNSVVSWWSRLTKSFPASWGDCSADRKRVLSTVDSCGDFVSVFVSSFPADRVLRRPSETLKHLDLPHRSREMVVRCCDHLQTHSESLALKVWPSSNSPGVWELFGSGDVLHPRIFELQISEDGIAVGKSQDLNSLHFLHWG